MIICEFGNFFLIGSVIRFFSVLEKILIQMFPENLLHYPFHTCPIVDEVARRIQVAQIALSQHPCVVGFNMIAQDQLRHRLSILSCTPVLPRVPLHSVYFRYICFSKYRLDCMLPRLSSANSSMKINRTATDHSRTSPTSGLLCTPPALVPLFGQ